MRRPKKIKILDTDVEGVLQGGVNEPQTAFVVGEVEIG